MNTGQTAIDDLNIDISNYTNAIDLEKTLPWDQINIEITKKFLLEEWGKAKEVQLTEDCRDGICTYCGICDKGIQPQYAPHKEIPSFKIAVDEQSNIPNIHYRVFFSKVGRLRFVAHLDTMRMIHNILRAVDLPVVFSHGILFCGDKKGLIRQKMIEENLLDAVIGLPSKLFPTTSIPVAILIFDRSREKGGAREECKNIIFVDASREFVSSKNQNTLLKENLDKIIGTYTKRTEVEKYSHIVEFKELKENDFNLSISRYVDTFEEEDIDIDALQIEINELEKELTEVRLNIDDKLQKIIKGDLK
jgi:hypothetical protein